MPDLFETAKLGNLESSEQTFQWTKAFVPMHNSMGVERAALFMQKMIDLHNNRSLNACLSRSKDKLNKQRFDELCAAYGLGQLEDTAEVRQRLVEGLKHGSFGPFDPLRLQAHCERIGLPPSVASTRSDRPA